MDNISDLKKNVLDFASHHHEFHFQSSYEYFNLGCGYLKQNEVEKSIETFDKSIFAYKENGDSFYARGFAKYCIKNQDFQSDYKQAFILKNQKHESSYVDEEMQYYTYPSIDKISNFSFLHRKNDNIKYEKLRSAGISAMYNSAHLAFIDKKYEDFTSMYEHIVEITSKLHFEYHVSLANKYFEIAELYRQTEMFYEAIFFCNKAIETEKNNPHQVAYENLLNICQQNIDNEDVVNI